MNTPTPKGQVRRTDSRGPVEPAAGGRHDAEPPWPGPAERKQAFQAGPERIPTKFLAWAAVAVMVLGLGGVLVDHFFSGPTGGNATTVTTATTPPPLVTSPPPTVGRSGQVPTAVPARTGPALPSPVRAMMGLVSVVPKAAPTFTLRDQRGMTVSLAALRGRVVVVSFFDGACDDICPVLSSELALADRDLGSAAQATVLLTVNTDPLAPQSAGVAGGGPAAALSNWHFLVGRLDQLVAVWRAYGVTIDRVRATDRLSHNEVLAFIDPAGRLRALATPVGDESPTGAFSLPPADEARWGAGIANQVRALLP